jgi:hypothetical protein
VNSAPRPGRTLEIRLAMMPRLRRSGWPVRSSARSTCHPFRTPDGDVIGDLQGVPQRVDYLAEFGVDVVWFWRIYCSPGSHLFSSVPHRTRTPIGSIILAYLAAIGVNLLSRGVANNVVSIVDLAYYARCRQ